MPFFTGPMPAVLVAGVLIVALLLWIVRDRRHPGPRLEGADGIDREEQCKGDRNCASDVETNRFR